MKQLVTAIVVIILILAIRYDLKHGVLTNQVKEPVVETVSIDEKSYLYFEQQVVPGDTMISIIETKLTHSLPVPISKAIDDFKLLNNGLAPEHMQIGEAYKFPLYNDRQAQ